MILEYNIPDFRPPIFKTSIYRAPPYTVHNSFPPKSTVNRGSTVLCKYCNRLVIENIMMVSITFGTFTSCRSYSKISITNNAIKNLSGVIEMHIL